MVDFGLEQVADRKLKRVKKGYKSMLRIAFIVFVLGGLGAYWLSNGRSVLEPKVRPSVAAGGPPASRGAALSDSAAVVLERRRVSGLMSVDRSWSYVCLEPGVGWVRVAAGAIGEDSVMFRGEKYQLP